MLKLLSLMTRKSDVPEAACDKYFIDEMPLPFGAGFDACKKYVRYRQRRNVGRPSQTAGLGLQLDAIEELWICGNWTEEMLAQAWSDGYLDYLQRHVAAATVFVFDEVEVVNILAANDNGDGMLKRLVPLVRKVGWTSKQFAEHWREKHAPLLKAVKPGPSFYHQLYVNSEIGLPSIPLLNVPIDGFSESWFADEAHMNAGSATPQGRALADDNRTYLDRSQRFFFDEVAIPV